MWRVLEGLEWVGFSLGESVWGAKDRASGTPALTPSEEILKEMSERWAENQKERC